MNMAHAKMTYDDLRMGKRLHRRGSHCPCRSMIYDDLPSYKGLIFHSCVKVPEGVARNNTLWYKKLWKITIFYG